MYNSLRTIFDFPGKAKSEVWKNFGFYLSEDGYTLDRTKAICKYCRISVRYTGNTTNLHTHYVNHHLRPEKIKHGNSPQMCFSEPEVSTPQQTLSEIVRMPVPVGTTGFVTKDVIKTTPLTLALMEYFIADLVPFDTINSQSFQNLMFTLDKNCELPSLKVLEEVVMPSLYEECMEKLLSKLEGLDYVTLTAHVWTASRKVITLSAVFISPTWNLNTFVLDTVPLPAELESQVLDKTFEDLEKKWRIRCEPIVVVDSEEVFKACVSRKWYRMRCFAETINKAVMKGLALPRIEEVIQSVRKLFHFFKSVPIGSVKPGTPDLHLLTLDSEDRWLSTFTMLQKAVEYFPAMETLLEEHGSKDDDMASIVFDPTQRKLCEGLVELLAPLSNASMLLCDQQMVSASLILPILKKLEMTFRDHKSDILEVTDVRDEVWTAINCTYKDDHIRDFLLVCSLLDPRYKGLRYVEPMEREKARRLMYDEALKPIMPEVQIKQEVDDEDEYIQSIIMGSPFSQTNEDGTKKRKVTPSTSKNECDWLSDVVGHKDDTASDSLSPMELLSAEIDRYMKEKQTTSQNPLSWWCERENLFPNLARLARKYMSVKGVSKPPEEVFLQEKEVVKLQRAAIRDKNLQQMMFLNGNYLNLKNQH